MSDPGCSEDGLIGTPEIGNDLFFRRVSEQPSSKPRNTEYSRNKNTCRFLPRHPLKYLMLILEEKK